MRWGLKVSYEFPNFGHFAYFRFISKKIWNFFSYAKSFLVFGREPSQFLNFSVLGSSFLLTSSLLKNYIPANFRPYVSLANQKKVICPYLKWSNKTYRVKYILIYPHPKKTSRRLISWRSMKAHFERGSIISVMEQKIFVTHRGVWKTSGLLRVYWLSSNLSNWTHYFDNAWIFPMS